MTTTNPPAAHAEPGVNHIDAADAYGAVHHV